MRNQTPPQYKTDSPEAQLHQALFSGKKPDTTHESPLESPTIEAMLKSPKALALALDIGLEFSPAMLPDALEKLVAGAETETQLEVAEASIDSHYSLPTLGLTTHLIEEEKSADGYRYHLLITKP